MALSALPLCLGAAPQLASAAPLRLRRGAGARRAVAARAPMAHAARAALSAGAGAEEEVSIRRRPPQGSQRLDVGPTFDFKLEAVTPDGTYVPNEDFKPRNILEEIVWYKDVEIQRWRDATPLATVKKAADAAPPARDFVGALRKMEASWGLPGLIAEVKKASPSKGVIQPDFDPVRIARGYEAGGAACLSVLTDEKFFQGSFDNLRLIREAGVTCPLLCKEFIVEPYQLFKARAHGADAVLLIAAVLPSQDLKYLGAIAASMGMAVLIEVHTEAELARVMKLHGVIPFMLGINNRDLGTFKVDLAITARLLATPAGAAARAAGVLVVGESGIFTVDDVKLLKSVGVGALLVGESIVKQKDVRAGVRALYGRTDLEDDCEKDPSAEECRVYE